MNHKHVALIVVLAFVLGISGTVMTDYWRTVSGGKQVSPIRNVVEFAGEPNPADIRGSFTFRDVTNNFNIPLADLAEAFAVQGMSDPALVRNGDLEHLYGEFEVFVDGNNYEAEIGNGSVKYFVSLYTGLPYELEDIEFLPLSALDVLQRTSQISDLEYAILLPYTIDLSSLNIDDEYVLSALGVEHLVSTEGPLNITGKTTFRELLDYGYTEPELIEVFGNNLPHPLTGVSEFSTQQGLSFGKVKEELANIR